MSDIPILQTDADIAAQAALAAQQAADAAAKALADTKVTSDNLSPRAQAKVNFKARAVVLGLSLTPNAFENLGETDQVYWETHTS